MKRRSLIIAAASLIFTQCSKVLEVSLTKQELDYSDKLSKQKFLKYSYARSLRSQGLYQLDNSSDPIIEKELLNYYNV